MNLENLEYYAKQFFSLPVTEQENWSNKTLNVSSRTFRRWCKAAEIYSVKLSNNVEIKTR